MDQAEKLRSVVKLKKQNYKPDARVITVTSGKGGVGKSNVAVNLAVQMGKRVLVFDADFGLANVEVMFGAIPKYNLADVIYHGKQITEIISEGPMGIGFVSGGTGVTGLGNLTDEQISYLLHCFGELDQMADNLAKMGMDAARGLPIMYWSLCWQARRFLWSQHRSRHH